MAFSDTKTCFSDSSRPLYYREPLNLTLYQMLISPRINVTSPLSFTFFFLVGCLFTFTQAMGNDLMVLTEHRWSNAGQPTKPEGPSSFLSSKARLSRLPVTTQPSPFFCFQGSCSHLLQLLTYWIRA